MTTMEPIISIRNVGKQFNAVRALNDVSFDVLPGELHAVMGENGAGKSTLINIACELLKPTKGSVVVGQTTVFGYFSQNSAPLNPENRLIEEVREIADHVEMGNGKSITAVQFLERFLFRREQHYTPIGKLSGGEKRRLQLLKILMTAPNFLILDEPTNDFDIDTLNVLEDFLEAFEGNVMVVSHDRYFLDRVCDHIFAFEDGGHIKDYPGNYTDYREWVVSKKKLPTEQPKEIVETVKKKEVMIEKRKLSFKEKQELEKLGNEIEVLEDYRAQLIEQLNGGDMPFNEISVVAKEIESITADLELKELRWLELSELEN